MAGVIPYGTDGGTANNYSVASTSPSIASMAPGVSVLVKIANANTAASTLKVSPQASASPVIWAGGSFIPNGTLLANQLVQFNYDGTNWQIAEGVPAYLSVFQFGVKGDGSTDDSTNLQVAVSDLEGTGIQLHMPAAIYYLNGALPITITGPLRITGDSILKNWVTSATATSSVPTTGTVIKISKTSTGTATVGVGSVFKITGAGVYMEQMDFYSSSQPTPSSTFAPTATPTAILVSPTNGNQDGGYTFRDIMVRGLSQGISCVGSATTIAIVDVDGLWGETWGPLLQLDGLGDTARVRRLHYWAFWSNDPNVEKWQISNTVAIDLGQCANPIFEDIYVVGCSTGMKLRDSTVAAEPAATAGTVMVTNFGFDSCVFGGLAACNTNTNIPASVFANGLVWGGPSVLGNTPTNSVAFWDGGGSQPARFQLTNVRIQGTENQALRLDNTAIVLTTGSWPGTYPGSSMLVSNVEIFGYNLSNQGGTGIGAASGTTFLLSNVHIYTSSLNPWIFGGKGAAATGGVPSKGTGTISGTFYTT